MSLTSALEAALDLALRDADAVSDSHPDRHAVANTEPDTLNQSWATPLRIRRKRSTKESNPDQLELLVLQ